MDDERESKRKKMAKDGVLHEQYTLDGWFVKVKPRYSIDQVLFSFVKKGTHAEQSFDVYMDIDTMRVWMEDVKSGEFSRTICAEKAAGVKYPKAYSYQTGKNGSLTVGFGVSSTAFCVISGSFVNPNGKKIYANIPADRTWMYTLANYFLETSREKFSAVCKETVDNSESYWKGKRNQEDTSRQPAPKDAENNDTFSSKAGVLYTMAKAGEASQKTDQYGRKYYCLPVRIQGMNGSFSDEISSLVIFQADLDKNSALNDAVHTILEKKPAELSYFSSVCEGQRSLLRLLSIATKASVK